jgi:hypothetical protein
MVLFVFVFDDSTTEEVRGYYYKPNEIFGIHFTEWEMFNNNLLNTYTKRNSSTVQNIRNFRINCEVNWENRLVTPII